MTAAGDLAGALRVYVITDRRLARGRGELDVVRAAVAGGATAVQLRGKDLSGRELYEVGRVLAAFARDAGILFIVDDRVDLALAVGADGVHVGQEDVPAAAARSILGPGKVLGVSADTPGDARRAERDGADYLGVGTVYPTASKPDAGEVVGLEGLRRVARSVRIPVVGIGGVTPERAADVVGAGAAGVAVISAVVSAADVEAAARALGGAVRLGLDRRGPGR